MSRDAGVADSPLRRVSWLAGCHYYSKFLFDPVACFRSLHRDYGPLVALGNFSALGRPDRVNLLAVGPELNRQILGDNDSYRTAGQTFIRGPEGSAQRRLRHGLTRMNGRQHAHYRKLAARHLQRTAVEGFHDDIVALAGQELDNWPVGTEADLWPLIKRLMRRISARTVFGDDDPGEALRVASMIDGFLNANYSPLVWAGALNVPGTPYYWALRHAERIERRILAWSQAKRSNGRQGKDLFSALVHAQDEDDRPIPDDVLAGQIAVLLTASHDNVSNSLAWSLFLLSQHPGVAADLMDELDATLHGAAPTAADLERLPLLDAVVKESMRVLPPVPYLVRVALRDVEIGGEHIRGGSRLILSPFLTHHLPELYARPDNFIPERWFAARPSPFEYLPFGAGLRRCVGFWLAQSTVKVCLALIVQRFRLDMLPGARIDRRIRFSMSPKHGLPMSIRKQDRRFEANPVVGNIHEMVDLTGPPPRMGAAAVPAPAR